MKFVLTALAITLAAPASAETGSFVIGGTTISFPIPAGYCRPTGEAVEAFKRLAAADTLNTTLIDLMPCANKGAVTADHIAVKTPTSAVNTNFPRAKLLTELKPDFNKPEFLAEAARNTAKLTDNLSAQAGSKVDIAGNFGPRGVDNDCAYLGGTLTFSTANGMKTPPQGAAACMSSVGEKFVSVNFYAVDPSNASVQRLTARARAMMLSMIAHKPN
jgi:hypothetical protein